MRTDQWLGRLVQIGASLLAINILSAAPLAAKTAVKIVALGDSLTAGFGVAPADAFPAQLERALKASGQAVELVNSGVSGDTAADGLDRLDWAVPDDAKAVIVELGANDGLRGIDPKATRATLNAVLTRLNARKLPVLLTGMRAPRNWGDAYAKEFDAMFADLAAAHGVLLYPFFLDGVVLDLALNQADGLHPNAKGVAVIVERITPHVEGLLGKVSAGP